MNVRSIQRPDRKFTRPRIFSLHIISSHISSFNNKYTSSFKGEFIPALNPLREEIFDLCGGSLGNHCDLMQPPPDSDFDSKIKKWVLQSAAREILYVKEFKPSEQHRICNCLRSPINKSSSINILKSNRFDSYHYSGLQTCGLGWVCPVCGSKISERRKNELTQGFHNWRSKGGEVYMLTLTAPHHVNQSLKYLSDAMIKAHRLFKNRKPWKRFFSSYNITGDIRGLEVTHSFFNGWHVHFHILLFFPLPLSPDSFVSIEDFLYTQWASACVSAGLDSPSREHGLRFEDGSRAAKYVSKWGLEHELTKSHIKKGHQGHYTPFDFLRLYIAGDTRYAELFREYTAVFKGKPQLKYSDGLRDILGLGKEKKDEEIAEEHIEEASLFAEIPLNVWKVILKASNERDPITKKKSNRSLIGRILIDVCPKGIESFYDFITDLMSKYKYFQVMVT